MPSLRAIIRKWFAEKDDQGRAVLYIRSQSDLESYISHPDQAPAGDLLIRSHVPLSKDHQRLIEALGRTRRVGTRFGIDAPPPVEIQNTLQEQARAALDRDLKSAAMLPPDVLKKMRDRAFCSDEIDGYMLIPSFYGDPRIGRAMFAYIDIHQYGPCPLQRWLREELSAFAPAAEKHFGWSEMKLQQELNLECIGGEIGLEPDLCMSSNEEDHYTILIGHVFYHVMLVAVRSCAARLRLGDDEPRNAVTAKEINDSLRAIIALYDGSAAAPTTDAIAAKLLPHQILIVERIAKSLRRFVIAHEMGHILLWKTGGRFDDFAIPWDTLQELATIGQAPSEQSDSWAEEFACDMLGVKLMQTSGLSAVDASDEFAPESYLPLIWDYASIRLWLTLWDHILHRMKLAGQPISTTHPPPNVRMILLDVAFPPWCQEFGKSLSDMLNYRMANL
jgi:hypothetical protein